VAARGAKRIYVAPQAVDNAFWSAPTDLAEASAFAVVRGTSGARKGSGAARCWR